MRTDSIQTLLTNNEPLPGSEPDRITDEAPVCPTKNVQCPYWTNNGCQVAVCWMNSDNDLALDTIEAFSIVA